MFGFGKKRLEALRQSIEDAQSLLDTNPNASGPALESHAFDLRNAHDAVLENDGEQAYADPMTSTLVERASALLAELDKRARQRSREARWSADAQESAQIANRLRIRRCRECDGATFFVHEMATINARTTTVNSAVIICAQCGDVRTRVRGAKDLAALADNRDFRRVDLPGGDGPFRG